MHSTLLSEKLGKIRNDEGRTRNHVQDLTAMDVVLEGGVQRLFLLCLFVGHDCASGGFLDDTAPGVLDRVKCLRLGSPYPTSGKP